MKFRESNDSSESCILTSDDDIHFKTVRSSKSFTLQRILTRTFLPNGYPDSVRKEYLAYQFWDSIQGLCSYLRGVLTTQSILIGAGVGVADKSATAAALVWIAKDGVGMVSSLCFAYLYSDQFEVDVKEFRLLADLLNNVALIFNLLISAFPDNFLLLSCSSAVCSSLCGLIAGATKARISAHFARGSHLADVTAKESTQETAVALLGLLIGYFCAKLIGDNITLTWAVFVVLLVVHQCANYLLVKVLVLDTLNPQRCWLLMRLSLIHDEGDAVINDPVTVAHLETLSRPLWLAVYGPRLGAPLEAITYSLAYIAQDKAPITLAALAKAWEGHPFLIGLDCKGRVVICIADHCDESSLLKAMLLGQYLTHRAPHSAYALFRLSRPDLKRRYLNLLLKDVAASLEWYEEAFLVHGLSAAGWDVGDGKSRLGAGTWRYRIESE